MNSIVTTIEKCKKSKSLYKELSMLIDIEESEIAYFLNQFTLFQLLSKDVQTNYVNYFNEIDIIRCELKENHKKESFYKCLSIFMKYYMKGRVLYCYMFCDNSVKMYIDFIKIFLLLMNFNM